MDICTLLLPSRFNINSLYQFLASLIGPDKQPLHQEVAFDFAHMSFIECDAMTGLTNAIQWLGRRGVKIFFKNHDSGSRALRYLDDCGFFAMLLGSPLSPYAHVRKTTLPARMVKHIDGHSWLEYEFSCWLAPKLGVPSSSLGDIRTSLKEIFNNIKDHSTEDTGCIHVQWHPNINRVRIAVADFGRGIPAVILGKYSATNDGEAIFLATQDGVTTKTTQGNCGVGLGVLVDYVVKGNGGSLGIYSERGQAHFYPTVAGVGRTLLTVSSYYPGTLFNIELRTDNLDVEEEERESLQW